MTNTIVTDVFYYAFAGLVPAVSQIPENPIDFRGAYLGSTLSEFRAQPFADQPDGRPRLFCSGDTLPPSTSRNRDFDVVRSNRLDDIRQVIVCAWFTARAGGGLTTWSRTNLLAAGYPTSHQIFEFTKASDGDREPILFHVSMRVRSDGKFALRTGLQERFGESTDTGSGVVDVERWEIGTHTVSLSDIGHLALTYSVPSLMAVVEARKERVFGRPESGL